VLLFAVAVGRTAGVLRPIAYVMGCLGVTYRVQGWVAGSEGFSPTHEIAIILAEVLNLARMIWLFVAAWRMRGSEARRLADEGVGARVRFYKPQHLTVLSTNLCE
jgi:hypothetical protein